MKWALWFGGILARQLPPQTMIDLTMKIWPQVWEHIPQDQHVVFLKSVAEKHLSDFLTDMSREERAALMNGLLPLIAREFPLVELDFLTAFPTPDSGYREGVRI